MRAAVRLPLAGLVAASLLAGAARGGLAKPAPASPPDTLTVMYEVGGLRVVQRVNPAKDVVAVRLYLLGGTRQLTESTAGIEALLLRSSAYGTKAFPGDEVRRAIGRTGSRMFVEPDADWTIFGFVGLARYLEDTWKVFADRLMYPVLDTNTIGRARARMLSAARQRQASPEERVEILAARSAFEGHPYAIDPEGTDSTLPLLTIGMLAGYQAREMVTSRMLLVVVGKASREQVEALVSGSLAQLPRGDYQWTMPPAPPRRPTRWVIDPRPQSTNYILGYFIGPPAGTKDYEAFRFGTRLLSALLFHSIRVKESLSYAASAPFLERALAVGGVYASTQRPDDVVGLMKSEIVHLQLMRIPPSFIQESADDYKLDFIAEAATSDGMANLLARAQLFQGDYRHATDYFEGLRRVNPEDVRNVAIRYMQYIQYAYVGDTTRMSGKW